MLFNCFYLFFTFISNCFNLFLKCLCKRKYLNVACLIILLWSEGNISSPVKYSYLSILPDDNADIFAASLLISYWSFSSLILSSVIMISFSILSKRLFLRHKGLANASVISFRKNMVLQYILCKDSYSLPKQYLVNDYRRFFEALVCLEFL